MKPSITMGSIKLPQILLAVGAVLLLAGLWIGWGGWQLRGAQLRKQNEDGWAARALREKLAAYERAYGPLPGSQATPASDH